MAQLEPPKRKCISGTCKRDARPYQRICDSCTASSRRRQKRNVRLGLCVVCGAPAEGVRRCKICDVFNRRCTRDWMRDLKRRAFEIIGTACVYCGESDLDVLTVGHINEDGAEHRRSGRILPGGSAMHRSIIYGLTGPHEVQPECANCNLRRAVQKRRRDAERRNA